MNKVLGLVLEPFIKKGLPGQLKNHLPTLNQKESLG